MKQVREIVTILDPNWYDERDQTVEGMLEVERCNAEMSEEYMDNLNASDVFTIEVIDDEIHKSPDNLCDTCIHGDVGGCEGEDVECLDDGSLNICKCTGHINKGLNNGKEKED